MHRARQHGIIVPVSAVVQAVSRLRAAELPHHPAPDRHASHIPDLPKFIRPSRAFCRSLVAVALEHQVGDVPDVDLRYHAGRLSGERLCTVNPPVCGAISSARRFFGLLSASLAASDLRSLLVAHNASTVAVKAGEQAPA